MPIDIPEGTRVLHLLPDDVLIISNVGELDPSDLRARLPEWLIAERKVIVFSEDVDVSVLRDHLVAGDAG